MPGLAGYGADHDRAVTVSRVADDVVALLV
ncbi:MAG: hypothetical protein H6Q90_4565, partial [Deltaproteobacteria bacterium]|nr:hypothetical protein [Deltaproteobacteria bacterium]